MIHTTINGVMLILFVLFLTKIILKPRDFYFNAILRPIDMITTPVLNIMGKVIPSTRTGLDVTPFIAIILLYILHSGSYIVLLGQPPGDAFFNGFYYIYQFLLKLFMFCVFVRNFVTTKSSNPIVNIFTGIVKPFERLFGFLAKTSRGKLISATLGVMICSGVIYRILLITETDSFFMIHLFTLPKKWAIALK